MNDLNFEEQLERFLEACDVWVAERLDEVAAQGKKLSDETIERLTLKIESDITGFIEKGVTAHSEHFIPTVLTDLHHLIFELELQKLGIDNQKQIHCYKDNGQVALSVVEGKLKPDNALLVMEINRAHQKKKGSSENGVCQDCVCGRK